MNSDLFIYLMRRFIDGIAQLDDMNGQELIGKNIMVWTLDRISVFSYLEW
jgi:hypothetical protein